MNYLSTLKWDLYHSLHQMYKSVMLNLFQGDISAFFSVNCDISPFEIIL